MAVVYWHWWLWQNCAHRIKVMPVPRILWLIPAVFSSCLLFAQGSGSTSSITPAPEMARLARTFVGEWNNVETMEPNERWPHGAERRGASHCELSTGGK